MSRELEPCPYCGDRPTVEPAMGPRQTTVPHVFCANGCMQTRIGHTGAVRNWNHRAKADRRVIEKYRLVRGMTRREAEGVE